MRLNGLKKPCVIISASGMCEFGRILHHLRNNIEDQRNTICIIGFRQRTPSAAELSSVNRRSRYSA